MEKVIGISIIVIFFLIYIFSDCSSCKEHFDDCKCRNLTLKCNVNKHLQRKCKWFRE